MKNILIKLDYSDFKRTYNYFPNLKMCHITRGDGTFSEQHGLDTQEQFLDFFQQDSGSRKKVREQIAETV